MTLAEVFVYLLTFVLMHILIRQLQRNPRNRRPLPPCLPSLPLVGSVPFIRDFANLPEQFMRKADQLGPVFGFYIGRKFCLVLNGKETIREALLKHSVPFADRLDVFIEKTHTNRNAKGIVMKHFDADFKRYHKLTLSILKEFGFGVKRLTERRIMVEMDALLKAIEEKEGQPFNPEQVLKDSVANVISGFLFGRTFDNTSATKKRALQRLCECTQKFQDSFEVALIVAPITRFIPFYRKRLEAGINAHEELMSLLEREIVNSLNDDGETADCLVKRFVSEEGPHFDREQLLFTIRDLFIGGSDTTSVTIFWCLVLLANSPAVQERLRRDIDSVVPRDRLASIDDKSELPYLEAVILETMRIRTLVPFSTAHAILADTQINGYFIPAGTMVLPNLYSVHMDPKVWLDPTEFRPERFLDAENSLIRRNLIMPFSVGKRSCLGEVLASQEVFLFLAALVQRFYVKPPSGVHRVNDTPEAPRGIVKPSPAIQLRLISRQPQL